MTPDEFGLSVGSGIAVALAIMGISNLVKWYQSKNKKISYLKTIKKQLENDKLMLDGLKSDLETGGVPSAFNTTIYHNFLSSEYYNPKNDSDFVDRLNEHLANIGRYKNSMERINLYSAIPQGTRKADLESSLLGVISKFSERVDTVITEIEKLIDNKKRD